jgi:hypothetical protein
MSKGLKITTNEVGGETLITLRGVMDENAKYETLPVEGRKSIRFDLAEVDSINSIGTQAWVRFLRSIPKGTAITVDRLPVLLVNQVNMLSSFFGGHVPNVRSVFVPYFCETCNDSQQPLVETAAVRAIGGEAPAVACTKCGTAMALDEDEGYFSFLARTAAA